MVREFDNFDKDGFMEYLQNEYPAFESSFLRGTVRNLVDFGMEHHNHSLDQLGYFLSDILPEIEFGEIVMFMDDSSLTQNGLKMKNDMLKRQGKEAPDSLDDMIRDAISFSRKDTISDNPREYDKKDWDLF